MENRDAYIHSLENSLTNNTFVKANLANYKGEIEGLKKILIKKIIIKNTAKISFTYRYATRDEVKNYDVNEGIKLVGESLASGFNFAVLFTLEFDLIYDVKKNGKSFTRKSKPTHNQLLSTNHDKQKHRLISPEKQYLQHLKITDKNGKVYKATQDKYRQINRYIEILSTWLQKLPKRDLIRVADMGSGKGYLTFALYDYLTNSLDINTEITGVEYRRDLVDLCNDISQKSAFSQLKFTQSTIEDFDPKNTNILIALHACDTATDDAIAKGIEAEADLIVVAPCCHKQIRREMEKGKAQNDLQFLTQHGIFMERQAEMVTDGIRALVLEYFGYSTKVFEFISDAHTPKNAMIIGLKNPKKATRNPQILKEIERVKGYFGIGRHHLEGVLVSKS